MHWIAVNVYTNTKVQQVWQNIFKSTSNSLSTILALSLDEIFWNSGTWLAFWVWSSRLIWKPGLSRDWNSGSTFSDGDILPRHKSRSPLCLSEQPLLRGAAASASSVSERQVCFHPSPWRTRYLAVSGNTTGGGIMMILGGFRLEGIPMIAASAKCQILSDGAPRKNSRQDPRIHARISERWSVRQTPATVFGCHGNRMSQEQSEVLVTSGHCMRCRTFLLVWVIWNLKSAHYGEWWLKKFSKSCQEIFNNNKLWYHVRCDNIESGRKHSYY